jgi:tetratricopeptide (TPR) repeat protein
MKNQILALSFGLMTIGTFAQKAELKAELKAAEKAIKKSEFAAALTAVNSLDAMEATMEAKYKAKYYYLKGQALSGQDSYSESADAFNKLFAYEIEIGKDKYTKLAQPMLNSMIEKISNKAAKLYNDDKDYKGASENFYLTYSLYPADTTTLYNAAISASLAKEYDVALGFYNELKTIGYTGVLTQYLAVNKETNETENLGGKGQRDLMVKTGGYINPTDETTESKQIEIIKNIGYILVSQGKTEEAIIAIKEARKSNPKDLNLLLNEADLYVKLEQMDKFGDLMEEAIKLDPMNPTLFFNLGVVNQNQKKTDEALRYYKKAIELKPDYADAYMNLSAAILSGQLAIVEEMNKNLSNFKKYDELEAKQKALYKKALPFLEKADGIKRTLETVRSLLNIYDILEMTDKADALRPVYKEMRG